MENQLKVSLENIIPLTEARDHFSQIVAEVQKDKLYVLTKGGKPAVAIIDVKYLEYITGGEIKKETIKEEIKKDPEKVGLPPMVEHPKPAFSSSPPPPPPPRPSPPFTPPTSPSPPPSKPLAMPEEPKTASLPPSTSSSPAAPSSPSEDTISHSSIFPAQNPKPPAQTPAPPEPPKINIGGPPQEEKATPKSKPPAPTGKADKIDIQFAPDQKDIQEPEDKTKLAPDDQVPPAQYAGENQEDKVEDMPID